MSGTVHYLQFFTWFCSVGSSRVENYSCFNFHYYYFYSLYSIHLFTIYLYHLSDPRDCLKQNLPSGHICEFNIFIPLLGILLWMVAPKILADIYWLVRRKQFLFLYLKRATELLVIIIGLLLLPILFNTFKFLFMNKYPFILRPS